MSCLRWALLLTIWGCQTVYSTSPDKEHKIHNIVLYPDKHSWCKTTEINQIVTFPGCNSVEIGNNVCMGACFSYSIPFSTPSAPGEVITPYCDSCQPAHFTWKEVKLTCESDSDEEEEGTVEMVKKVQVITNCTCSSCEKGMLNFQDQHKTSERIKAEVPELMSLMNQKNREEEEEEENDEEKDESVHIVTQLPPHSQFQDYKDLDNVIEVDDDKEKEEENQSGEEKIEIVHVNYKNSQVHLVEGPHHSLVVKPDVIPHHAQSTPKRRHKIENDDEEVPSLLENQFKIHDHEDYPDQLAVETRKEFTEGTPEILSVPELIYKEQSHGEEENQKQVETQQKELHIHNHHGYHNRKQSDSEEENISHHGHHRHHQNSKEASQENLKDEPKGVKIVEVSHHHLTPAEEGVQLSYEVKSDNKDKSQTSGEHEEELEE